MIDQLLEATGDYSNRLCIIEDTTAAKVKEKITNFIEQHRSAEENLKEVFFYFSGHGQFYEDEYLTTSSRISRIKKGSRPL